VVGGADEQVVGKEASQARERMAHRRLRQTYAARCAGHRPFSDQRIEGLQQIEVDGTYIHRTNVYYTIN
jgi:hypothetical protein